MCPVVVAAENFVDGPVAVVFFMLVLIAGYGICFALWWFVFRTPKDDDETRRDGPPGVSGGS